MKRITRDDILDRDAYQRDRDTTRRHIMVMKNRRRVALGDHATLHFETRDTMIYQIHEMLRAEGSWERAGAIADELEAYNPLVPADGELTATLMLEYETPAERDHSLRELVGIDAHLWLQVGDTPPLRAVFDGAQVTHTRVSAVQYVRWTLDEVRQDLVRQQGAVVRVVIDHPGYQAQAVLGEATRQELADDLSG